MDACPNCGTPYTFVSSSDDGYARSICACERANKCFKCKRGQHQPVTQAVLNDAYEVRRYACKTHGLLEAEDFEPPAAAIGEKVKPAKKTSAPASTVKPPSPPLVPVGDSLSNERSGMEVLESAYLVKRFSETKRAVQEDLKSKASQYEVACLNCKSVHMYGKRKILADDDKYSIKVVCPKCDHTGYRIL